MLVIGRYEVTYANSASISSTLVFEDIVRVQRDSGLDKGSGSEDATDISHRHKVTINVAEVELDDSAALMELELFPGVVRKDLRGIVCGLKVEVRSFRR